jgi:hypothetical protein
MIKTISLAGLFASICGVGVAYASAFLPSGEPAWAPFVMAICLAGAMVSMMALGATRGGRIGRLAFPFAFVFVVVAGGFTLVLTMPRIDPAEPVFWFGLPPAAALVMYGIGLVPLLVVPLAYALTFDEQALTEEDMQRVRRSMHPPEAPRVEPVLEAVGAGAARAE